MSYDEAPLIIAHRGNSVDAPENTLVAFQEAVKIGSDYIELDVHLTKDLVPVVIHDTLLSRTTSHEKHDLVSDFTLAQVKELDAGSWFSDHFIGQRVPTLLEVLNMPLGKTGLMIEIKEDSNKPDILAKRVLETIKESPFSGSIVIGSFSPTILQAVQKIDPQIPLCGIVEFEVQFPQFYIANPGTYAIDYKICSEKTINALKKIGKKVWVWTVDKPEEIQEMISKKVNAIITNRPRDILK